MPEYIERGAAKHAADLAFDMTETEYDMICQKLDCVPAADVAPVVHGRWIADGDFVICSQCEAEINQKNSLGMDNSKNYCPNCGARMDLEEDTYEM